MKKTGRNSLMAVVGSLLLATLLACTHRPLYHRYRPVGTDGWQRGDTLFFALPPAPRSGHYLVTLGLRYAPSFPYQGFTLVAETALSPSLPSRLDTIRVATSTEQGMPLGQGVNLMQQQVPLFRIRLLKGQQATIGLRHIMTREVLPDLRDIGLLIEQE